MKRAFTQAIGQSRGNNIYLVHGGADHTGHSAWYFIRVEVAKVRAFVKAISTNAIDLNYFGTVLESGYGKEPPYSLVEHMREHHGYMG